MKKSSLHLTRGALVASLYVVLTLLSSVFGLSGGIIQFRISEALCILPVFMPEAVAGVTLGCFISNIITGANPFDILFGTLATLIGVLVARLFRYAPNIVKSFASIPTVISNTLIIPFILIYTYGAEKSYLFIALTVFLGEFVCAGIGGYLLYTALKKHLKAEH